MKNITLNIGILFCYFLSTAQPPEPPNGFRWVLFDQYSDEFNGASLDGTKWQNLFNRGWLGRPPAKFEPTAVSVSGGNLQIKSGKYATPQGKFTMFGGAVTSIEETAHYGYYECKFKASKISMSTTFWLSNSKQAYNPTSCNGDRYSQELDIAEAVGDTKSSGSGFRTKMKSNTHFRYVPCDGSREIFNSNGGDSDPLSSEVWQDYHVYGAQWHDEKSVTFYADNQQQKTVFFKTQIKNSRTTNTTFNEPEPFDRPMFMAMVTETYDWLTPPTDPELNNNNINTAYYDWVRSYRLFPITTPEGSSNTEVNSVFTENIKFTTAPVLANGNGKVTISYLYKANQNREFKLHIFNASNVEVYTSDFVLLEGFGKNQMDITLSSPLPNGSYNIFADMRPIEGDNTQIISATEGLTEILSTSAFEKVNFAVNVFPNPTQSVVNFVTEGVQGKTKISIYNTLGQLQYEGNMDSNGMKLNIKRLLSKGVYFAVFENDKRSAFRKIIVN